MCGITGFISKHSDKKKIIKKMTDKLIHRGPDGEGYYIDDMIALGHRRLSIIDIATGEEPIYSENGNLILIFNGEIYNYLELKDKLNKHTFKSKSDAEVIIHGYEEWGLDLLSKLRGMFAFALWDKKNKKLFCARDPFGIKPFYYYHFKDTFMFASEIKAFLPHPAFHKEFNKNLLAPYLTFSFTPTCETFFKNVYTLDAGSYLIYQDNNLSISKYYVPTWSELESTLEEDSKKIDEVMRETVSYHLTSDVPVYTFLSSGVDSSYITSLARPKEAYTISYEEEKFSEYAYAKNLCSKLNIHSNCAITKKDEYLDIVPEIMYHLDEPLSDPACIALYFLAKRASKDTKVILSGEGSDEFFGGYNTYLEYFSLAKYKMIPKFVRKIIGNIFSFLPEFRGRNFIVRNKEEIEDSYVGVNPLFSKKELKKLIYHNSFSIKEILHQSINNFSCNDLVKMQQIDVVFWLKKDILLKADKMSMANSLEVRVPFVDKEVFKLASHLPLKEKINKNNTKIALRLAAKKVISNQNYQKKKLGFPVPLKEWIKTPEYILEIKKSIKQDFVKELFNQDYALKLLDDTIKGKACYKKIWAIYTFIKWYEVFFLND